MSIKYNIRIYIHTMQIHKFYKYIILLNDSFINFISYIITSICITIKIQQCVYIYIRIYIYKSSNAYMYTRVCVYALKESNIYNRFFAGIYLK